MRQNNSGSFHIYLFSASVSDFFYPIFYTFLPLLAYHLGASPLEIGFVGGGVNIMYSFMPFLMGRFLDKVRARKLFIISSFSILSVVSFLYSVASSPLVLIVTRLGEGVAWAMLWPVLLLGITQDSAREARRSLSIYNFTWSGAAALGPLAGAALVFFTSYQVTFVIAALSLAVTVFVNSVPISKWKGNRSLQTSGENFTLSQSLSDPAADDRQKTAPANDDNYDDETKERAFEVALYFTATALVSMTAEILFTFFPPFSNSIGISVLLLGGIVFSFSGARFLAFFLTTKDRVRSRLLEREKRNWNVLVALVILALASLLLIIPGAITLLYFVSFAVVGVIFAVIGAISQVGIITESNPNRMGMAAGLYESAFGIGASIGPIMAGAISYKSLTTSFFVPALGIFASLLVLFTVGAISRSRKSR
jgi:MFS family permease